MKIFVGNLSYDTTEEELQESFAAHGDVKNVNVIKDHESGRSRGFAFVEMMEADGDKAIAALNGKELGGRKLNVNQARPQTERSGGSRPANRSFSSF